MTRVLWCILGCRQELPLCAQVIFFPGVSGEGLAFLNACEWCGVGEPYCFRRCANVHLESSNTRLPTWGTMEYTSEMLRMKYVYECARTMGDNVTQHKKWVWLREKWGGPCRHPWHSPIIKTRWHGEKKTDSLAVFTVAYDCRKSRGHFECRRKWAGVILGVGNCWGTAREKKHCVWCFVWHKNLLTATVTQELCQGSQVSSGIWLRATEREHPKAPRLAWRCHPAARVSKTSRGEVKEGWK